ncbi:MAG: hypothetical protein K2X46_10135 [Roseomonas sp.]|nr:hypothetical protein [Roseomonas sp.]
MKRIEIMRPGTFRSIGGADVGFTEDQLRVTAAAYDAGKNSAPVVIGHPTLEAPAYGWVKGLDFADGALGAYVGDLEPSFADAVKAGRYKKVSASFFAPNAPANPRPGIYYLRHVGFLGAIPPAVPGLKVASFAAGDADIIDFAHEADAMKVSDDVDTQAARALRRIAELEARERTRAEAEVRSFCDDLVKAGKLPGGLMELAFASITAMPEDGIVSFGEGDKAARLPARDALRRLLTSLPCMVEFGEVTPRTGPNMSGGGDGGLAMPEGYTADAEQVAFADKAEALAAEKGIPFADAVRRLSATGRR